MALTCAERQARRYARNPARCRALARAWYAAHREECRLRRMTPEFRAKRREYMRGYREQEAAA